MTSHFDPTEVARIRSEIGRHKTKYGDVSSPVPRTVEPRMFGEGEHAAGMGDAVAGFTDAVHGQYSAAEKLLDSVERALDATERSQLDAEHANVDSFTPKEN